MLENVRKHFGVDFWLGDRATLANNSVAATEQWKKKKKKLCKCRNLSTKIDGQTDTYKHRRHNNSEGSVPNYRTLKT